MNDSTLKLITTSLPHLPFLMLSMVGVAVALKRYRRMGLAAVWAGLGFGLSILSIVVVVFGRYWLLVQIDHGETTKTTVLVFTWINIADYFIRFCGTFFLVMAIFAKRPDFVGQDT